MKDNKAPRPDDISIVFIKHTKTETVVIISNIFNRCVSGENIPNDWKISYIDPNLIEASRNYCQYYRAISITS